MDITISEKSPVYNKLVALGNELSLDPSLLAAGMCHAALNTPGGKQANDAARTETPAVRHQVAAPAAPAAAPTTGLLETLTA